MSAFDNETYELLVRAAAVSEEYPRHFDPATQYGQAIIEIKNDVETVTTQQASLKESERRKKLATEARGAARTDLRSYMETASRIARGLKEAVFERPRSRKDGTLVGIARMWAQHAAPKKQLFIDSGLKDFPEGLTDRAAAASQAIAEQEAAKNEYQALQAAIEATLTHAFSAYKRLAPMMAYVLRDDPPALAVWEQACHVEKRSVQKPPETENSPTAAA